MSAPLSPPPVVEAGKPELPAYIASGCIGIRVLDIPLLPGIVMVNGFAGLHPTVEVEAAAQAPYPLAGDICIDRVWLTTAPHLAEFVDQQYDFASGELTTHFLFRANGVTARVAVLTFCSRVEPTLAVQEVVVEVDAPCTLTLRASVRANGIPGRMSRRNLSEPGTDNHIVDGSLCWDSLGSVSRCGVAFWTECLAPVDVSKTKRDFGLEADLATDYQIQAAPGTRYRVRQIASLVPSVTHPDPDREATRLVARASMTGFDRLREDNRQAWRDLWSGRILVTARDPRWQQLADAAFFYLNTSVHPSAPASTSIYGLAQWRDYHYYYGHVMWDIETFAVPTLLASQPAAAKALLAYRTRTLGEARHNARLNGRGGVQFAWESSPLNGAEATPAPASAAWYEDHNSLDIAHAFAQYAQVTGDERFLRDSAAPVLYGVADWLTTRVVRRGAGFSIPRTMGIAERSLPADNDAFTVMSGQVVLREAIQCAERLGDPVPAQWRDVAAGLSLRVSRKTGAILAHDGYHASEEKGATPDPLAGLFPLGYAVDPELEQATLRFYVDLAPGYIGSPMLSPFYGVWAAWLGERRLAARLFEEGYADLVYGRFLQTLEHSSGRFPEKAPSGPFFANMGAFLTGLVFGLPGIRVGSDEPASWPRRRVVLPEGWDRIEVERAWITGRPMRIVAEHGAERSRIEGSASA